MKVMDLLRLIPALPMAGSTAQMISITTGYRFGHSVFPYVSCYDKGIFNVFEEFFGCISTLVLRLYSVVRYMFFSIFAVSASFLSSFFKLIRLSLCPALAMADIKNTAVNVCERVDRKTIKRFAAFALTAERTGKTKEEVSKENEPSEKVKAIKINIFTQSISKRKNSLEKFFRKVDLSKNTENDYEEKYFTEKHFEVFKNRKGFSKSKDLKNEDKNNSAKKEFPVKYSN